MADPISARCILNGAAHSGGASDTRDQLKALFEKEGRPVDIKVAGPNDNVAGLAKTAVDEGCKLIIAGGGDGTINAVAGALVGTDAVLGVLPLGTLNHFAKDLSIPLDLPGAVATALHGRVLAVDVGEVNGETFLNNSSLGLYPGLVVGREALQGAGHGKWTSFARALAFALWRFRSMTAHMKLDGKDSVFTTTPFIFIGNNRYQTAFPNIGERETLVGGDLWIYQAPHAGRLRLLKLAVRALLGLTTKGELIANPAKDVEIRSSRETVRVARDGEVDRMNCPLHYKILPKALKVMTPVPEPSAHA